MAYIIPIHRASSVRHAIKLKFLTPDQDCLIVAKANRLEIYTQSSDGFSLVHAKAIYGKVTMLQKLRPASASTDHLFVGTDRYSYFTVSWDATGNQLKTERSFVDVADKSSRDSQTGDRCLIDPTGRFLTLELLEGVITVVPFVQVLSKHKRKSAPAEPGSLGDPVIARIEELFVRSSGFLHSPSDGPKSRPRLALLYEDNQKKVRVKLRELAYSPASSVEPAGVNFEEVENTGLQELELGASHLIPVPAPIYGILILGETSITYYDDRKKETVAQPLEEATVFVAWEQVDNQRWLIADDYGNLYFLMLVINTRGDVEGWKLDKIGQSSRPSVMIYLDGGYVYIGSHQGDSQIILINDAKVEVIQTFSNIAPVLDFTVMDLGSRAGDSQTNEFSSGQARIVTGSGAFEDGSLRSVRSGVGLEVLGELPPMAHITDLWALKSTGEGDYRDTLLVSFVDHTKIFLFGAEGDVEEVDDFKGLTVSEGTILAQNISGGKLIQVTEKSVRLADLDGGMVIAQWSPSSGQTITSASANDENLVLAIGGQDLKVLRIAEDLAPLSEKHFGVESQVSGVTIPDSPASICVVGFWQSATVSLLDLSNLETLRSEVLGEPGEAVPRSVLVTQVLPNQPPTLFVAMADGTAVTFSMQKDHSFSAKKTVVLGSEQPSFKALPRANGLYNVFATCEHPSLIYSSEGKMVYSAVNAEKASRVCHFDSQAYPGSIAVATPEDLKIALVDNERTTQIQTLPVHETVRRVAYSPKEKVFGLGTIKRTIADGVESVKSHFKIADEVIFKELASYDLRENELVECVIRAEFSHGKDDTGKDNSVERFVVGTAYLDDERDEAVKGRILVFDVNKNSDLRPATEVSTMGACRALAMVDGKIVAALIKTVVLYELETQRFGQLHLSKKASYRVCTAPVDLSVTGNIIAVADLMKSVSLVEYTRGENGMPHSLNEVARHFRVSWATAVANVGQDTWLESDAEGNLIVLHRNINGVTADDKRKLEVVSEMRLGEMVNRIRRINVPLTPGTAVIPRAFLATVEGSIYLFALIHPTRQNLLMELQSSLAEHVQNPGYMPFLKYRAFKTLVRESDEPFRFVDGELIERFLDCSVELQERIVEKVGVSAEDVRALVEGLRRMH